MMRPVADLWGISIAIRGMIEAFEGTHAFAGDVNCNVLARCPQNVIARIWWGAKLRIALHTNAQGRGPLTINELSTFVLHFD